MDETGLCRCGPPAGLLPVFSGETEYELERLGIFEELGFLARELNGSKRTIIVNERPNRSNLEDSLRYAEGLAELEDYEEYVTLAFNPRAEELLEAINRPIYPKNWQNTQGGEKYEI